MSEKHQCRGDLSDAELQGTIAQVRSVLRSPAVDPEFRRRLRQRVVEERARVMAEPRAVPIWRRLGRVVASRPRVSLGTLALGAAALLIVGLLLPRILLPAVRVTLSSSVAGASSVDPATPLSIAFDTPVDRQSVAGAIRLSPATEVRTAWQGNTIRISAVHGLTPNVSYVLTVDGARARTSAGAPFANSLQMVFGTAGMGTSSQPAAPPVPLAVQSLAPAGNDGEAVITPDGSVVASSARVLNSHRQLVSGVLRFQNNSVQRLDQPSLAICLSPNGNALAWLDDSAAGVTSIVMADGNGFNRKVVTVPVDSGSPLGWIPNGTAVTFVGGGRLRSVAANGQVRLLSNQPVDAAHDTIVLSSGGRYVYLRQPASASGPRPAAGRVTDLASGQTHSLTGLVGEPAFSVDGATTAWFSALGSTVGLASAPSAGGPVRTARLALSPGDQASRLSLSPDGANVAYSVQHANGKQETRIASLLTGATLSVAAEGLGDEAAYWSPAGDRLALVTQTAQGSRIATAPLPARPAQGLAAAAASAFANAQISKDEPALGELAAPSLATSSLPQPTRAQVVKVTPAAGNRWSADLRMIWDAQPSDPQTRVADERVELQPSPGLGRLAVSQVSVGRIAPQSSGPHVQEISPLSHDTVSVAFDSDLEAGSAAQAVHVSASDGRPLAAQISYDSARRVVSIRLPSTAQGPIRISVTSKLRDISGSRMTGDVTISEILSNHD